MPLWPTLLPQERIKLRISSTSMCQSHIETPGTLILSSQRILWESADKSRHIAETFSNIKKHMVQKSKGMIRFILKSPNNTGKASKKNITFCFKSHVQRSLKDADITAGKLIHGKPGRKMSQYQPRLKNRSSAAVISAANTESTHRNDTNTSMSNRQSSFEPIIKNSMTKQKGQHRVQLTDAIKKKLTKTQLQLLEMNLDVYTSFVNMVVSGVISSTEFWSNCTQKLDGIRRQNTLRLGASVLGHKPLQSSPRKYNSYSSSDILHHVSKKSSPSTMKQNDMFHSESEIIELNVNSMKEIFLNEPDVFRRYQETVPDIETETSFWKRYFQQKKDNEIIDMTDTMTNIQGNKSNKKIDKKNLLRKLKNERKKMAQSGSIALTLSDKLGPYRPNTGTLLGFNENISEDIDGDFSLAGLPTIKKKGENIVEKWNKGGQQILDYTELRSLDKLQQQQKQNNDTNDSKCKVNNFGPSHGSNSTSDVAKELSKEKSNNFVHFSCDIKNNPKKMKKIKTVQIQNNKSTIGSTIVNSNNDDSNNDDSNNDDNNDDKSNSSNNDDNDIISKQQQEYFYNEISTLSPPKTNETDHMNKTIKLKNMWNFLPVEVKFFRNKSRNLQQQSELYSSLKDLTISTQEILKHLWSVITQLSIVKGRRKNGSDNLWLWTKGNRLAVQLLARKKQCEMQYTFWMSAFDVVVPGNAKISRKSESMLQNNSAANAFRNLMSQMDCALTALNTIGITRRWNKKQTGKSTKKRKHDFSDIIVVE